MTQVPPMGKRKHILLIGSRVFARDAATLLESCNGADMLHTKRVTVELFLAKWRPDCAIINCDDLEHEPLAEIEALTRFQPHVPIVLVSSRSESQIPASSVSAILLPSEMCRM